MDTHPRVSHTVLAADALVIRQVSSQREVLLITRKHFPDAGRLAFPGGHVDFNEDPESACLRELREECSLSGSIQSLVAVAGKPGRDPRGHYVTILYLVSVSDFTGMQAGDDAAVARFYDLQEVLNHPERVAFDHHSLLTSALPLIDRFYPIPSGE